MKVGDKVRVECKGECHTMASGISGFGIIEDTLEGKETNWDYGVRFDDHQYWMHSKECLTVISEVIPTVPDNRSHNLPYGSLQNVLDEAFKQAAEGKGKERHANDDKYEDQIMFIIEKLDLGFMRSQAIKKIIESKRLIDIGKKEQAVTDLLGAINYIAGKIIEVEK
jgi:hypothetical protein